MNDWRVWLKGLLAAIISGSANGVVTAYSLLGIDSEHFNLNTGLHNVLQVAGSVAVISGFLGAAMYLRQSPVPGEASKAEVKP